MGLIVGLYGIVNLFSSYCQALTLSALTYQSKNVSGNLIFQERPLRHVCPTGKTTFQRARALKFADFEDGVVCACAEQERCDYIINRNSADFGKSTVTVLTPGEFITQQLN